MKLQTQIPLAKAPKGIDYDSEILLLGSCFTEHIGRKLAYFKFQNFQNPFGILFHPKAIENLVERSISQRTYTEEEVFFYEGRWHCYDVHSRLSHVSQKEVLQKLNDGLEGTLQQFKRATHIVITLGTAWAYRHQQKNTFVANCHKVPQKEFSKELSSIDDIKRSLEHTLERIRDVNASAQIIFTISPVRHLKDGFVENQISKSHLIASVHDFLKSPSLEGGRGEAYFPSYELMMDELRDYRFYEPDMVHPNALAIDYIWEKFKEVWISDTAYPVMEEVAAVQKGLLHKPFNPTSEQYRAFKKSLQQKITYLQKKYPFMGFEK